MRRFFTEPTSILEGQAVITGQEAKHMSLTLRMQPGNRIELFDGSGQLYLAEITSISKRAVNCKIITSRRCQDGPPYLFVAQSIIKGKKMDLVVQKATELGVSGLYPITTQHCTVKRTSPNQLSRWQRIAHESCKQCGRSIPMRCHPPTVLIDLLRNSTDFDRKIILWEKEVEHGLNITSKTSRSVLLLVGPEGGFSPNEVELAQSFGFNSATLGSLTLRAETATIAATSIVQHQLGNLNKNKTTPWESDP